MDFSGYGRLNTEDKLTFSKYGLRPLTKTQWLFLEVMRNCLGGDGMGPWFEGRILLGGLNEKQVALVLNDLGVILYSALYIHCLKRGLVLKEDLRPKFYSNFQLCNSLRVCWFHGVNIYFSFETYTGKYSNFTLVDRYMQTYDDFKCSMAVLSGLRLLPEHWREAVEFLGYL